MERETHNDSDHHIVYITTDDESSSRLSLDEGLYSSSTLSSDEGLSSSPRLSSDEGLYTSARSSPFGDDDIPDEEGTTSSTSGCDNIWNLMKLLATLVQIVAALVVFILAKDEKPHAPLLTWLIGYTCGCSTKGLLIFFEYFRKYKQVGEYSSTGIDKLMERLNIGLTCSFIVWLFWGIVWISARHSSPSNAPKLYRLTLVFIGFSCIEFATKVLLCAAEGPEGVSLYKGPINDDSSCCICLGKYREKKGLIRKLECSHIFHLECIENWLRVKSTCPLCQSLVRG